MFYLFGQIEWKGITDPVTNIGALAILGVFLLKVVPALVTMLAKAMADRDDKFTKAIDTIQDKQDGRNRELVASIQSQTITLTTSWDKGFGALQGSVLSACKSPR